jgi:hypothetical protein
MKGSSRESKEGSLRERLDPVAKVRQREPPCPGRAIGALRRLVHAAAADESDALIAQACLDRALLSCP